jgi:hypothetical protein
MSRKEHGMIRRMIVMVLGLAAAGCGSPFVGEWQSTAFPKEESPAGATVMKIVITKDFTFDGYYEKFDGTKITEEEGVGTWRETAPKQIQLTTTDGDSKLSAILFDRSTLVVSANGGTVRLQRVK